MLFKKKNKTFNFEEVLQDLNYENRLISRLSFTGIKFIAAIMVLVSSTFLFFAYKLQIQNYDLYLRKSNTNQFLTVPILPTRGSIIDVNGEVLVKTEKVAGDENAYDRVYSQREGLGHVLGYVKYPQKDTSGKYWQNNFEGVSGLEAYYDQLLSGSVGKKIFEKDISERQNNTFVVEQAIEGKDVKISIDAELQEYVYKNLKDYVIANKFKAGSVLIMDIDTGQLLVMTNYPEYDPKKMIQTISSSTSETAKERNDYINKISQDKNTPLLNRAIAGTFAPGSTLKPVFALAALQGGLITPVTSIFSSGRIEIQNAVDPTLKSVFRDWKAHGWVNVRTALANSSDVFFYAIGGGYENQKGMGIKKIVEYSTSFGVDNTTGVDLGGEKTGNIPSPDWKQKVFKESWRLGDTYTTSIGQFGFLVTPIGLLRLTAALATDGILITPKLRLDENKAIKKTINQKIDSQWYEVVKDGMRMVVTQGTAKNLNSDFFEISGKSGTAEVGVKKDKIQSWIAGYFPSKKPKYAFVFLCELGLRDISPTPNTLAKQVFEYMYLTRPELFKDVQPEV